MTFEQWLDGVKFDPRGLVPVVVHDAAGGRVLTLAWADREALERTRATGLAHFHSRSRDALWMKGETSGHVQGVRRMVRDCDADAVLYEVDPRGPACHTGADTCFFEAPVEPASPRAGAGDAGRPMGTSAPGPAGSTPAPPAPEEGLAFLGQLFELIRTRRAELPEGSYTTRLFREGRAKIAQKVGEEAVEVCVAALAQTGERVVDESADLLYHLLVLWAELGVEPAEVAARLRERHAARRRP
jgi:phosphoribosyl-AMP cyclohydrolase / phosphoribosyl-ATP pyrophosphohydrolase